LHYLSGFCDAVSVIVTAGSVFSLIQGGRKGGLEDSSVPTEASTDGETKAVKKGRQRSYSSSPKKQKLEQKVNRKAVTAPQKPQRGDPLMLKTTGPPPHGMNSKKDVVAENVKPDQEPAINEEKQPDLAERSEQDVAGTGNGQDLI
jgi:hypothetical protein